MNEDGKSWLSLGSACPWRFKVSSRDAHGAAGEVVTSHSILCIDHVIERGKGKRLVDRASLCPTLLQQARTGVRLAVQGETWSCTENTTGDVTIYIYNLYT